jgi:flagellar export protein FliJ
MVRLHRWMLDEKRRKLADLQTFADRLTEDLNALDRDIEAERAAAGRSDQAGSVFPAFVAATLGRRKKLCETIANLGKEVETARGELAEASSELKKYELALKNQELQESLRCSMREQVNLDEVGASLYRRDRAAGD